MRFSLGKTGVYRRWKRKEGRKRKKRKHCAIWKGREDRRRVYETSFGFSSTCYWRFGFFSFFEPLDIYSVQSKFVSWGGNFRKSLAVNFPLEMQIGSRDLFESVFSKIDLFVFFFFFWPILTTLRTFFFFFLKFRNRTLEYDECPRIDRAIIMIEIGRGFFSDLLFIRVLIIRRGRAAPLPFLLNNFNIRVNTRRDISSGNTLIASREVGRIG